MPGFAPMNASPLRRRAAGVELAIRVALVGSGDNRGVVRGGLRGRRRRGRDRRQRQQAGKDLMFQRVAPQTAYAFCARRDT